jgi:hypothetical protein
MSSKFVVSLTARVRVLTSGLQSVPLQISDSAHSFSFRTFVGPYVFSNISKYIMSYRSFGMLPRLPSQQKHI